MAAVEGPVQLSPSRPEGSPDAPLEMARGTSRAASPDPSQDEVLTQEMLEEDKKAQEENVKEEEKEEAKWRQQMEERKAQEKDLEEQRYKCLMHLLNRSNFYSQHLLSQIQRQSEAQKKGRKPKQVASSQEETQSSQESGSEGSQGAKKRGREGEAKRPAKRRRTSKYQIKDVIDEETVRGMAEGSKEGSKEDEGVVREYQPELFENGTMRPYQLDGFSWLKVLYENGVNGILGDEMGLGKTIQTIALVCHLVQKGVPGPFMVVAPLSTLPNWQAEFMRFAPKVPVVLYHGGEAVRRDKRREISRCTTLEGMPAPVMPVVLTSFDIVIRDTQVLNKYNWRYLCIDEGHRIKNHKCRLTKSLKTFTSTNRLLLTGTPLQNNLAELWALLNFLMPEIFDSLDVFESWFDITDLMQDDGDQKIVQQEREKNIISSLQNILSPFFLRRVKNDVDLDIPAKKELLVYTPMTETQLELYQATLTHDHSHFNALKNKNTNIEYDEKGRPKRRSKKDVNYSALLDENESPKSLDRYLQAIREMNEKQETEAVKKTSEKKTAVINVKLNNKMMQCRKIVNHPYLVNYPLTPEGEFKVDEGLLSVSGKLQVLDQLLKELHRRNHRVLLFSQMTSMMDILEDYLTLRPKFRYKRLDGNRSLEERQEDIKDFNSKDSDAFLFMLSTRAGGLGINLTSADTVIIYDSDWNPQADLQAQDRCHRIGQTKPVLILRLVTASTVDERIVERAAAKRKLEKLIIQAGKFKDSLKGDKAMEKVLDQEELLKLLKERDHERIHKASQGNIFTKKELNQLLDRSNLDKKGKKDTSKGEEEEVKGVFKVIDSGKEE